MTQLIIVLVCVSAGIAALHLATRVTSPPPANAGCGPSATDSRERLYLRFVRDAGEPRLRALSDARLLELGSGTCASLRDYHGDADLVVLEAVSAGASIDVVLPVVIGAGFFLAPEFTADVQQIATRGRTLTW
jgi:hypothetical protein